MRSLHSRLAFRGPGRGNRFRQRIAAWFAAKAATDFRIEVLDQPHMSRRNPEGAKTDASHFALQNLAEISQTLFVTFCRIL